MIAADGLRYTHREIALEHEVNYYRYVDKALGFIGKSSKVC